MNVRNLGSRRLFLIFGATLLLLPSLVVLASRQGEEAVSANARGEALAEKKAPAGDALRLNSLGVAYLNQGNAAEGQKYFERALAGDPEFAIARMNLGIALLAQQKV